MAKRTMMWAMPGMAFVLALGGMLMSGPSWASLMKRTRDQASSAGTVGCKDCCKPAAGLFGSSNTGAGGNNTQHCGLGGKNPINYYTGEHIYSSTDLDDGGFDGMSLSRASVDVTPYSDTLFGSSWRWGMGQLIDIGNQVNLVMNSRHARSWTKVKDGGGNVISYTSDFFYKDTLSILDANTLVFTDENGNIMTFYNFTYSDPNFRGKLIQAFNSYLVSPNAGGVSGSSVLTSYTAGGLCTGFTQQEQTSGVVDSANTSTLAVTLGGTFPTPVVLTAVLSHKVAGVTSTVRSASYEYHDGSFPTSGPAGALMRVTIKDSAGSTIEKKYYRYGSAAGRVTLRYVLEGKAYEKVLALLGSDGAIVSAADNAISNYVDEWRYDSVTGRVTYEYIKTYGVVQFGAPTSSGFTNGVNTWDKMVVETLPFGGTNTVYTNYAGQLLLTDYKRFFSSLHWITYYQYDSAARLISVATPSAVSTYTMTSPPANLGVVLNASSGLIKLTNYAATTTATTSTAGDVAGFITSRQVQKGSTGTPSTTESYTYKLHTSTGFVATTTYILAQKSVYEDPNSIINGKRTTDYSYTWLIPPGTTQESNQIESMTTQYPSVATTNNGSGLRTARVQYFDKWRHPTWFKDEDGFIQMKAWNRLTGACTQSIVDVNTSTVPGAPVGWSTPSGGGLNLTTSYVDDFLGRWTKITDPASQLTYKVYNDANWEVRTYPGWTGTATTGPTQVIRGDKPGWYDETLTMSATPNHPSGFPDGTEPIASVISDTREYWGQGNTTSEISIINRDSYFNPPVWVPSTTYGAVGTNFYRTMLDNYHGLPYENTDWTGTYRQFDYGDDRNLLGATRIGTTNNPTIQDMAYEYDGAPIAVGNNNLTKSSQFTSASVSLDTLYTYDYRDRRTQVQTPDGVITVSTLDNLGRVTQEQTYAGSVTSANLRAQTQTLYDEKGQVYQKIAFQVDCETDASPGTVRDSRTTNFWYNARGLQAKARGPNGEFSKTSYDGASRRISNFTCFDDSEANTDYASALTVGTGGAGSDTVVVQTVYAYDADSNVIQTTSYRRCPSSSKLGDLSTSWAATDSRRMFTAEWFDAVNRSTAFADYGTNGNTTLSRPTTPPPLPTGDTISYIESLYGYDLGGRQNSVTDNKSRVTQKVYDGLSRVTTLVEDFTGSGVPTETSLDTNKTTNYVFDSSGRLSQLVALNPKGSGSGVQSQTTQYVYGTTANLSSPAVYRNDLLVAEIYPDSDDTYTPTNGAGAQLGNGTDGVYDRVEYTYDYASRKSTVKDQRGVIHTYTYDASGRFSADTLTTPLPTGVDGSVLRCGISYDSISRKQALTNYSDTGGATVFNQVKYTYSNLGRAVKREDSHVGAVVPGTSPSVQVAYSDGGPGTTGGVGKYVRPVSSTYPNGRVVFFNYPAAGSTSVGDHLSRIDNIANDSGATQYGQYSYMGAGTILDVTHPLVTNGLVYRQGPDSNPGGWDQFDRQIMTKWRNTAMTNTHAEWDYTYDSVSNRLTKKNNASVTSTKNDEFYVYDGLKRVTEINRGQLTGSPLTITDANRTFGQNWNALESLGNWRGFQVAPTGGANYSFVQTRLHNSANEIDNNNTDTDVPVGSISNSWILPTADKAGNTTTSPVPGNETAGYFHTYDAWNRLVKVQNGTRAAPGTEVVEFQYDAENWRTVKLVPNGSNWNRTDYYFNLRWQCVEERTLTNVAGKLTVATVPSFQWVWDLKYIDAVLLRDVVPIDTTKRLYYCQDANQNTTALVQESTGVVVERYAYDPYGKVSVMDINWASQLSTLFNNEILFAGYRQDPETNLSLARNRYYHATLGRWLHRDPIRYRGGLNLFEYVRSRPIRMLDPSGLAPFPNIPGVPNYNTNPTSCRDTFYVTVTKPARSTRLPHDLQDEGLAAAQFEAREKALADARAAIVDEAKDRCEKYARSSGTNCDKAKRYGDPQEGSDVMGVTVGKTNNYYHGQGPDSRGGMFYYEAAGRVYQAFKCTCGDEKKDQDRDNQAQNALDAEALKQRMAHEDAAAAMGQSGMTLDDMGNVLDAVLDALKKLVGSIPPPPFPGPIPGGRGSPWKGGYSTP